MSFSIKKFFSTILCVLICNVSVAESKKSQFSPSDYPSFPKETWEYFTNMLPKDLLTHLLKRHNASYITACKGNYVFDNFEEYVVGFIYGKENKGYSKVYSINPETREISSIVVQEYPNIASGITNYVVPAVEVYCEKGVIFSKTQMNGLPAYVFDEKSKSFKYSPVHSVSEP